MHTGRGPAAAPPCAFARSAEASAAGSMGAEGRERRRGRERKEGGGERVRRGGGEGRTSTALHLCFWTATNSRSSAATMSLTMTRTQLPARPACACSLGLHRRCKKQHRQARHDELRHVDLFKGPCPRRHSPMSCLELVQPAVARRPDHNTSSTSSCRCAAIHSLTH